MAISADHSDGYDELRRFARFLLRGERPGHTVQPTDLVHEAYLRLSKVNPSPELWLATARRTMERFLTDYARKRNCLKRGGGNAQRIPFHEDVELVADPMADFEDAMTISETLREIASESPRSAQIVWLKFYRGLTHDEMAEVLEVNPRTIDRSWKLARALVLDKLSDDFGVGGLVSA